MSEHDEGRRHLLLAGVSTMAVAVLPGCSGGQATSGSTDAGNASGGGCAPSCGTGTFGVEFGEYPALQQVGGSASLSAPGFKDDHCGKDGILVIQTAAGTYVALSSSCTHQCCTVGFDAASGEIVCPCHGSRYDTTGKVVHGPAQAPLQQLTVCADECGVLVTLP